MLKQKPKTPTSISRGLLLVASLAVLVVGLAPLVARQKTALAATNGTINFQARLLTAAGNVVPDGQYNVEFKLYNIDTGGTALWTETRTGTDKVTVKNGYLTVNLGSVTAFGGSINWDQELWLTMNIGGTGSPSWDGEMNPRLKLTSVPYAFRSGAVVSANGNVVLTVDENDVSGKICVQNSANCGFVQGVATDFIQNTTSPQTANINVTSALNTSSAMTIQGASSANVPVAVIRGGATPGSSADVLQLQNSANAVLFKVDNDGDAELARSLRINYVPGATSQLNIQGPSGDFITVNSENNRFFVGDQTNCSGRFCVGYTLNGTGGASYTNAYNLSQVNVSSASTIIGQDIKLSDTSSSVNNIIRALRIDARGTTNTSATLNGFQVFIPKTTSASTFGGNAIHVQQSNQDDSGVVNIFRITNTGQALFQSTNNTATAFQILNSSGNSMFTLNTNGTNNGIYIGGGSGADGAGGRLFFGATGDSGVWIGESGTTDTNVLALNGNSGLNLLVNNTAVASFSNNGALTLQNSTNSTNAAQIKNAAGTQLFNVDSTADSSNLVTNGSFEQNTNGWSGRSATLSPTTSQAYVGTGSLQITTSATTDAGAKQNVTLVAGQTYTLSFMARSAAAFTSFAFGYSADGSNETTYVTNVSTMAVLSWTKYSMDITPTAVSGTPYIFFKQTTNVGRTFYIDAVQLDQVGNPYTESRFAINGSIVSPLVFQNASDSTNAFGIYNASGSGIFNVDTRNSRVGIGAAAPQARLHVVATTGTATLINHTGASGNILQLQRAGNDVVTVSNSGTMLLQPSTDANNAFQVRSRTGSINALTVDTTGSTTVTVGGTLKVGGDVLIQNSTGDSTSAFNIKTSLGNNLLTVDTSHGRVGINLGSDTTPLLASTGLQVQGALRLSGTTEDIFTTPNNSNVGTKINIPLYNPGGSAQVLALGIGSTSDTTARVISLFDARKTAHQPTIAVFNPAVQGVTAGENDALGLSWDGTTTGYLKTLGADIGIRSNTTDIATFGTTNGINLLQDTAVAAGKTFTVSGTLRASTINAAASGDVISIGTVGLGIDLNQNTAVAANKNFTAQGESTFKSATDSTSAFRILTTGNTALLTANTTGTDTGIYIAGAGTSGGGGRLFFGSTGDTGTWIGEDGTTNTNILALNGNGGIKLMANGTAALTISSTGSATFKNTTDSYNAFQVLGVGDVPLLRADTTTRKIAIGAYPVGEANNLIGQLDIYPTHDTRVGINMKAPSTNYVGKYIQIQDANAVNVFSLFSDGIVQTSGGVFMSNTQSAAATNSNSTSFKSGDVTGAGSSSGQSTFKSGDAAAGSSGAVTLTSGTASGTSGAVTIDVGDASTKGQIFLGNNYASQITVGSSTATSATNLRGSTVNIGVNGLAGDNGTVNIANALGGTQSVFIGNNVGGSSVAINGGTLYMGATDVDHTISIGTGNAVQSVTIGSTNTTSATTVYSGSGGTTFKSSTGATAFNILNASNVPLFNVDSSTSRVYIGNPTSDSTGALLVLDTKTGASDPTGVAGGMYYNSTLQKMRCYEGDGYWVDCRPSARSSYFFSTDFMGMVTGAAAGETLKAFGSTGAGHSPLTGETGRPGIVQQTGSTSPGYATMVTRSSDGIIFGNGDAWRYETAVRIPILSDVTNTFKYYTGFVDVDNNDAIVDGCFFTYSDGINTGRWQGTCRSNSNGTAGNNEATCNAGGAQVSPSQWYKLEVIVNSAGNSVDFKVDGILKCTITTFIPNTAGRGTGFGSIFAKTAGTNTRTANVDYIEVNGQFSSAR